LRGKINRCQVPRPSMTPETTVSKWLLCREVEDGREWRVMAGTHLSGAVAPIPRLRPGFDPLRPVANGRS